MNEQLTLLMELQDIDKRIRTRRNEQAAIPQQLTALQQRAQENTAGLDRAREMLATAQKAKRDRDGDLEEGGRKVEKLKARTSEIKTNKEYQAQLKEIEAAEKENKTIEDDILKLMENIDSATAEIANTEKRNVEENTEIEEERKKLDATMTSLAEALAAEERTRSELAHRIDASLLSQYEKRYDSVAGRVVVEARSESCSGCFMSIPPQLFVNVKKGDAILTCPHCHRMLYYKEAIAPKG